MAQHANIFPRISSDDRKDSVMNKKAIETIRLLGQQVLQFKKMLEEQSGTINTLKQEISTLKKKANATEGDMKLIVIDQKDHTKQLRWLKGAISGQAITKTVSPEIDDFSERVISRYEPQQVQKETPVIPKPIPVAQSKQTEEQNMDAAYKTISSAINNARAKLGLDPHEDLPGTIKQQNKVYSEIHNPIEAKAKEFVFGRLPKMLDLD